MAFHIALYMCIQYSVLNDQRDNCFLLLFPVIRQEINDNFRKHKEENDPEKIKEVSVT